MKQNQQNDAQALSEHRAQIIDCLIFPQKTIIVRTGERPLNLTEVVRKDPARLTALGLVKEPVFSPTCIDPARGSWDVGTFSVWIDRETSKPIDAQTVKVLDRLPDSVENLPTSALIDLLGPTYLRNRTDAEKLTAILNDRGPSSSWSDQS
jgi:hypothetical protein